MKTKHLDRQCPICSSETGNFIFAQSFIVPESFPLSPGNNNFINKDIISCSRCGFCFTDDSLSQSDYNKYYAKYAKHSNITFQNIDIPIDEFNAYLIDLICKACNHDVNKSVADIGCGSGNLLIGLKSKKFTQLCGIDISNATGTYLENYDIPYQRGSITEKNLFTKKDAALFDFVSIISVLEHVLDLNHGISQISSILEDNGYILISVPDASLFHKHLPNPLFQISLEHINHFDSISLCNLMSKHGYQQRFSENFVLECERFTSNQMIHLFQKTNTTTSTNFTFADGAAQSIAKLSYRWQKQSVNEIVNELTCSQEEIAIYGAGIYTYNLLSDTELKNCNIVSFIDGNPNKQRETLLGLPINGPEFLSNFSGSIVLSVANELESVKNALRKKGINNKTYIL